MDCPLRWKNGFTGICGFQAHKWSMAPAPLANALTPCWNRSAVPKRSVTGVKREEHLISVCVKISAGWHIFLQLRDSDTIGHVKIKIRDIEDIPARQQMLMLNGRELEDWRTISSCITSTCSSLRLVMRRLLEPSICLCVVSAILNIDKASLAPKYDCDFTHMIDDGTRIMRGGEMYHRPFGWKRYALNVLGRYADDRWLVGKGIGAQSNEDEWPVSYHGTGQENAKSISQVGYKLCKGKRFQYGRGIYSAPDPATAVLWADAFEHNGKRFKCVLQNRVNPNTLMKIESSVTGICEYWLSPNDDDVRPYGILLREA